MTDALYKAQEALKNLDIQLSSFEPLNQLSAQTGVPRTYLVLAGGFFYFLLIFINAAGIGELLSNVAGFGVPAYASLKALNTPTKTDDTELLCYWVIFAYLNLIEFYSSTILYWMPFYWFIRTFFLLWLNLPQFKGAQILYNHIVKPLTNHFFNLPSEEANGNQDMAAQVDDTADAVATGADPK